MAKPPRRYWDAGCFIAWLNGEKDRVDACREVLHAAERGELEIVTSAITLVEVIKMKSSPIQIPREHSLKIERFFQNSYIVVVQVTRKVAESARELIWDNPVLRPKDAVHVATALRSELVCFETFDRDFDVYNGKIGDPPLVVRTPRMDQASLKLVAPGEEINSASTDVVEDVLAEIKPAEVN